MLLGILKDGQSARSIILLLSSSVGHFFIVRAFVHIDETWLTVNTVSVE